jgi:hypothetical protein
MRKTKKNMDEIKYEGTTKAIPNKGFSANLKVNANNEN